MSLTLNAIHHVELTNISPRTLFFEVLDQAIDAVGMMEFGFKHLVVLMLLISGTSTLNAKEITTKVVDGLGRPVSNVKVNIHWLKAVTEDDVREITLAKLKSDQNGLVKGNYDETSVPHDETISYGVSKKGYQEYTSSNYKPEYIVKREYKLIDLKRIIKLSGDKQIEQLREFLAGEYTNSKLPLEEQVFIEDEKLRPALRSLLPDPHVGIAATGLLSLIGVPEDLQLIVDHAPPPKDEAFGSRWAYQVVTALLEPSSDKEWLFLRDSAINKYEDRWVEYGAIQTLKLIASPNSKRILNEAGLINKSRVEELQQAIKYIDSKPEPIADKNLVNAGKKIARILNIGKWQKNSKPRYNKKKDKALIDCEYIAGRDWLLYTATFHKIAGIWELRGVRETMQALRPL